MNKHFIVAALAAALLLPAAVPAQCEDNVKTLLERSMRTDDLQERRQLRERIAALSPDSYEGLFARGWLSTDNNTAIELYTKAISANSDYWMAYNNRAQAQLLLKNAKLAEKDMEKALKLLAKDIKKSGGKDAYFYVWSGNISKLLKNYADAEKFYLKAIELEPQKYTYRLILADSYMAEAPAKAETYLRECITKFPADAAVYHAKLATIMPTTTVDDYKRAAGEMSKAIELAPQNADYYQLRARFNISAYGFENAAALEDITKAMELDPANREAVFLRARIATARKDYALAAEYYARLMPLGMGYNAYFFCGKNFEAMGMKSHALWAYRRAESNGYGGSDLKPSITALAGITPQEPDWARRYIKNPDTELKSSARKVITKLPAATPVTVDTFQDGYLLVSAGKSLTGWVSKDDISWTKPDIAKPILRITEKRFDDPRLHVSGVAYDDLGVKSVKFGDRELPRLNRPVDKGNYADAFPFEINVNVTPGVKTVFIVSDNNDNVVELPLDIEEPVVDYTPLYRTLTVTKTSDIKKEPQADSPALRQISAETLLASIGERDGWYYLQGGGWLDKNNAAPVTAKEESTTLTVQAHAKPATGSAVLSEPVDVDVEIPALNISNPDAVAVVIGIKDYKSAEVPAVENALNDAAVMKKYLVQAFGYREENIIYLENPTKGDFERVFGTEKSFKGQLFNYIKPEKSDIFVYYSGHGAPDTETKTSYFVPSDAHPHYVRLSGYPLSLFYSNLEKLPARSRTVVLDACFSGGSQAGTLLSKASPLVLTPTDTAAPKGINLFASSSGDEISSWYPEKKHSMYTYFFLKAIGKQGGPGGASFGAVQKYIDENVPYLARRLYNRSQTPQFTGDPDNWFGAKR